ncbi:hypothetical protein C2W64_04174 [Brevibacillus laterosporus]|nr:hypothetical protein C2W64_04174 [Brevibacillus laterosporus]
MGKWRERKEISATVRIKKCPQIPFYSVFVDISYQLDRSPE